MRRIWHDNGLSIVLSLLFLLSLAGQSVAGHRHNNAQQREHGQPVESYVDYVTSTAFLEAVGENWESEFLQMGMYVILTVTLFQRGSAESKDPDKKGTPVDRKPDPKRPGAPWPVRHGGFALALYQRSLSLAFLALFLLSMLMHAVGGVGEYNEDQALHGSAERLSTLQYLGTSQFWFESLQNWQSEFLAVLSVVVLSIFLRQHGSPESKPVDAANGQTGNDE